jgi:hypothetical protein
VPLGAVTERLDRGFGGYSHQLRVEQAVGQPLRQLQDGVWGLNIDVDHALAGVKHVGAGAPHAQGGL